MAQITKALQIFFYNGVTVALAAAAYKSKIRTLYRLNPAGTGWGTFSPASTFNAVASLEAGNFYFLDAAALPIDIEGAALTMLSVPANSLPVANAGSDITITLPVTSVALVGTGTDADGNLTSKQWSQVTGPVTVQGLDESAESVVATGLTVAGIYQFDFTVVDDKGASATDRTIVTVNAAVSSGISNVDFDGDSLLTRWNLLNAKSIPELVKDGLAPSNFNVVALADWNNTNQNNKAVPGQTAQEMRTNAADISACFDPTKTRNYLVFLIGANDLLQGRPLADIKSDVTAYCAARVAEGFTLVALTVTAFFDANWTDEDLAAAEVRRADLNSWLVTNRVTLGIKGLGKTGQDYRIGKVTRPANLQYFTDTTHHTLLGHQVVADEYVIPIIQGLAAGQESVVKEAPADPAETVVTTWNQDVTGLTLVDDTNAGIIYSKQFSNLTPEGLNLTGNTGKFVAGPAYLELTKSTTEFVIVAPRFTTGVDFLVKIDGQTVGRGTTKADVQQPSRIVFRVPNLSSGQHTLRIEAIGTSETTYLLFDAIYFAPVTSSVDQSVAGMTRVNSHDVTNGIEYPIGAWLETSNDTVLDLDNGDHKYSNEAGATFQLTRSLSRIKLRNCRLPAGAPLQIFIDNQEVVGTTCRADETQSGSIIWDSGALTPGLHTVRFVRASGAPAGSYALIDSLYYTPAV